MVFTVEQDVHRLVHRVTCDLFSDELLLTMSRQEFRQRLREQLQRFGDEILAAWERLYGEGMQE